MDPQKSEHGIHAIAPPERRREWRESRRVPVEVSGFDARGRFFTERTSTCDVSDSGCSFLLNYELEKDSAVSVRVVRRRNGMMHDDPPVLFRVAWIRQTHPGWPKWTVACQKMQPVRLWTVGFPVEADGAAAGGPEPPDHVPPAA
jgi:PilZ domain